MRPLSERVAVVTGAARGLGKAAALELAERGIKVALVDRKREEAKEAAEECARFGVTAQAYALDQADPAAVEESFRQIAADFGGIDLLFGNAGTGKFAPLADMPKADWDMVLNVNLSGTFYVCQEAARYMIAGRAGGKIVLTASSGSTTVADQLGAYCVAKAGVLMLTKQLASELGNHRINVNAILPGVIETGMTNYMLGREEWRNMLVRQTPTGRWGTALEVAKLVAFLLSDDAGYINGEGIMIDGGSTLHGAPRWYSLDYSREHEADWDDLFQEYPYKTERQ